MPESYVHSSAAFYGNGIQRIFPVDNIMDIIEIDLSKDLTLMMTSPAGDSPEKQKMWVVFL